MHQDVKKVLFTEEQIAAKCQQLGQQLTQDYAGKEHDVLFVGILKGSLPFMMDLIRHVELDIAIDFMAASSYAGTESEGKVLIKKDLDADVRGKDILIVEDIIDTGLTLEELIKLLYARGAHDVKTIALLDKPSRRTQKVRADYIGFEIENEFVIGYGLDFNQKYRNLPYIGVLKEECYK